MLVYLSTWFLNAFLDRNRNPLQQLSQLKLLLLEREKEERGREIKERERETDRQRGVNNSQNFVVNQRLLDHRS